jgi:protein TonB
VRNTLFPFLLVSTVLHLLLMFSWYGRALRPPAIEQIPIEIFNVPEKAPPPPAVGKAAPPRTAAPPPAKAPRETPREKPTRAELPLGQRAKIDRSGSEPPAKLSKTPEKVPEKPIEKAESEQDFETAKDDLAVLRRGEPTLQELLPPGFNLYTGETRKDARPVRLDTRDPLQKRYMDKVEQALRIAWDDPRVAPSALKPYGLEGRAVVEFTIRESGVVEDVHLVKSSGFPPIDQEVIRVVIAAAPNFGPIPRAVGARSLVITLGMTFENLGRKYNFSPG